MEHKIRQLPEKGENIEIEYKSCVNRLPSSLYETVCAFLNRNGGHILLGVEDDGNVIGVDKN